MELGHVPLTKVSPRAQEVVGGATAQGDAFDRMGSGSRPALDLDVIEFYELARRAASTARRGVGAAASIPLPDGAPNGGGNMSTPDEDLAKILGKAISVLLTQVRKQKFAATSMT